MAQKTTDKKNPEVSIKRIVSDRFLEGIQEAIDSGVVKNTRDLAMRIKEEPKEFSLMKDSSKKRYVDVEMFYKVVNALGFNANYFFVEGGSKTEKLQREGVQINGGTVNGNHNVVLTGQAVSNSGDVYFNVQKLIQSLPGKDKKAILEKIGSLEAQTVGMNNVIEDLKKTIDRYERELESRDKHIRALEKLNSLLEQPKSKKK